MEGPTFLEMQYSPFRWWMVLGTEFRPYDGYLPNETGKFQEMFKFTMGGMEKCQKITLIRPFLGVFRQMDGNAKKESHPCFQVVDMGAMGPLRCSKCKAYINPFMQFHDYGKKFTCNFCGAVTATPNEYAENVGPDGRRRDADQRPELCRGSVEFAAPQEFMVGISLACFLHDKPWSN